MAPKTKEVFIIQKYFMEQILIPDKLLNFKELNMLKSPTIHERWQSHTNRPVRNCK